MTVTLPASKATATAGDVTEVTVDVRQGSIYLVLERQLAKSGVTKWTGTLLDLPVSVVLDFLAHAYNADGDEIFEGKTSHILSMGGETVEIAVEPLGAETGGTGVKVKFNPVVVSIYGERDGSEVIWNATVEDDRPVSELSFDWSFKGSSAYFVDPKANPARMTGYTPSASGELELTVTDADGGSTTFTYDIPPDLFTDGVVNYLPVSGGSGVALLVNTSYVDYGTSNSSEASNLEATLESQGHSVATFTGITAADISAAIDGKAVLAIPEQENGDLNSVLDSAARTAIADFVSAGGRLIIFFDLSTYYLQLLNATFGYSISDTSSSGPYSYASTAASGTPFVSGAPASLPDHSATDPVQTATLLTGSSAIYTTTDGDSVLTFISRGSGSIVIVGWDWYDAQPTGSKDDGWLTVLDLAIP